MKRRLRVPSVVVLPFGWLLVFFLAPFGIVAKISLSEPAVAQPPYRPLLELTGGTAGWRTFLAGLGPENYATLLSDPIYARAATSSLAIAALSTAILLAVGFPFALALARAAPGWRPLLLALVVVPFWTSLLIRVYAWIAILRPDGFADQLLRSVGLSGALLNTDAAIVLGAVYAYLPFMVLPLYASLERQDPALLEAAADLGASPWARFRTVTVPLAGPGIAAGSLLCFIPITGEFLLPDLLGGPDTLMLGRVLWSEFFANRDWPLAAAVALVASAVLLGPILLFRHAETRRQEARA